MRGILEGAITAVAEEAISVRSARPTALRLPGRKRPPLHAKDIEPAVAVEVEQADSAAHRLGEVAGLGPSIVVDEPEPDRLGVVGEVSGDDGRGWRGDVVVGCLEVGERLVEFLVLGPTRRAGSGRCGPRRDRARAGGPETTNPWPRTSAPGIRPGEQRSAGRWSWRRWRGACGRGPGNGRYSPCGGGVRGRGYLAGFDGEDREPLQGPRVAGRLIHQGFQGLTLGLAMVPVGGEPGCAAQAFRPVRSSRLAIARGPARRPSRRRVARAESSRACQTGGSRGRRPRQAVSQRSASWKSPRPDRQVRPTEPDPIVIRRLLRRLLEDPTHHRDGHRLGVEHPEVTEGAGRVGGPGPFLLEEASDLAETPLVSQEPGEGLAQLGRIRPSAASGRFQKLLQIREPAAFQELSEQLVTFASCRSGEGRPTPNPRPGRQRPCRSTGGLLAETEPVMDLGRARSERQEPGKSRPRRAEPPRGDLPTRPRKFSADPPAGSDAVRAPAQRRPGRGPPAYAAGTTCSAWKHVLAQADLIDRRSPLR